MKSAYLASTAGLATALVASLALAGCGATGPGNLDAKSILLASVHLTTSQTFHADVTVSETLAASGSQAGQLGGAGQTVDLTMRLSVENPKRVSVDMTATFAGRPLHIESVVYDGALYVSTDAGATFKSLPVGALPTSEYGTGSAVQYLESVGTVTDAGAGTADGVAVEKYHATFDPAKVLDTIRSALKALQSSSFQGILQHITLSGGSIDATVDHSGRLVSEDGSIDAGIDMSSVSAALRGTTLSVHAAFHGHFRDYGTAITVPPPAHVTGTTALP
jgi:hypothetical protein